MLNLLLGKFSPERTLDCARDPVAENRFCVKALIAVLLVWNIIWFLLPFLTVPGIFFDVLENLEWGRYWQLGYDKHPFVSMWITRFFYDLTGTPAVTYLLNQISISAAVVCVWLLARKFLPPYSALAAALLTLTLQYYSCWAVEFNNDVIAISIWGAAALFFWNALEKQRIRDWLLTVFFCFLAVMTKYYAVVLFASMALVLLCRAEGRASFRKPGVYLAGVFFLLLILPNVLWLIRHDFLPFRYAEESALEEANGPFYLRALKNEWELFLCVAERLMAFFAFWLLLFFRPGVKKGEPFSFRRFFLLTMAFGPLAITFLFPLLTGGKIKSTWLASCFSLWGVVLFEFLRPRVTKRTIGLLLVALGVVCLGYAADFVYNTVLKMPYRGRRCRYEVYPGRAVADAVTKEWRARSGEPLRYVFASRKQGCYLAYYVPEKPGAFYFADAQICPWIDPADALARGGMVVWEITNPTEEESPGEWLNNLGSRRNDLVYLEPKTFSRLTQPRLGALVKKSPKAVRIGMAFLPPAVK